MPSGNDCLSVSEYEDESAVKEGMWLILHSADLGHEGDSFFFFFFLR